MPFGLAVDKTDAVCRVFLIESGSVGFFIIGVKKKYLIIGYPGKKDVMRNVEEQAQDNDAALFERTAYFAVRIYRNIFAGHKFAVNRKMTDRAYLVEPAADIAHGGSRGAVLAWLAGFTVGVHTVEHDKFDDIRQYLLTLVEIAESVDEGNRAAVILRGLIIQEIFHFGISSIKREKISGESYAML